MKLNTYLLILVYCVILLYLFCLSIVNHLTVLCLLCAGFVIGLCAVKLSL
jgi:hypothetical protein